MSWRENRGFTVWLSQPVAKREPLVNNVLMNRILFTAAMLSAMAFCSCSPDSDTRTREAKALPNIVLILADDMGLGDLGAYNPESRTATPNLDRLASEGAVYTDMHSPSAVCTPTRYGLLTGRYAWRTGLKSGVLWGYSPYLIDPERSTLASMLRNAGYNTAGTGKWHLGLGNAEETDYEGPLVPGPATAGFDYYFGIPASLDMEPYLFFENDHAVEVPSEEIEGSAHRRQNGGGFWRAGPIAPNFRHHEVLQTVTDKAVEKLKEMAADDDPFFLYVPLTAPHTPWLPSGDFKGRSGAGYYGDFCMQVDDCVGQVLTVLEEAAGEEETLVIFTSDNGAHWPVSDIEKFGHKANLDYRGQKADIWEGGHRVPLIARWQGTITPGEKVNEMLCLTDIYSTLAALTGQEPGESEAEDSFNFLPVLKGEAPASPVRESIVHHSVSGVFAVRKGEWKLIQGLGSGGFTAPASEEPVEGGPEGQLYNLREDPAETTNLWLEQPGIVEELTALLEEIKRRGGSRK